MPAISEADAVNNQNAIRRAVRKCLGYCLLLGCVCCVGFLVLGKTVGIMLYNSEMAGHFIIILSFMCPFLYLNTTLTSILPVSYTHLDVYKRQGRCLIPKN